MPAASGRCAASASAGRPSCVHMESGWCASARPRCRRISAGTSAGTIRTSCTPTTSRRRSWPRSTCRAGPSGLNWRCSRTIRGRRTDVALTAGCEALLLLDLLQRERVGDVVLVDVADVLHGLASDPLGGNPLDVVEPDVRVQPALLGFTAQLTKASGPAVVGGKREQLLVQRVDRLVGKVLVDGEPDVLDAGVDVRVHLG